MNFISADPDENFLLGKWVSEPTGRWELGFCPMLFGVRVRLGLAGDVVVLVDYCAGNNPDFLNEILKVMRLILGPMPEHIGTDELRMQFPESRKKPIYLDPVWTILLAQAEAAWRSNPYLTSNSKLNNEKSP